MKGVYKITNRVNGKIYVGRSRDIFKRFVSHFELLKRGKHGNKEFQADYDEALGAHNFIFEILEECLMKDINERETFWIQKLSAIEKGYNKIERDEDIIDLPRPIKERYAKKALTKIIGNKKEIQLIDFEDGELLEDLLNMFGRNIDLFREDHEILIIPNSFRELKNPPYVFLQEDFNRSLTGEKK